MNKIKTTFWLFLKNPLAGIIGGLQVVRKKFLLDYRLFSNGFSLYPATIVFHPTARCNLRCKMCVVNSYSFPKELTLGQIKRIINQIAFFKPHFYIAGGEPLLRNDLEKIIAYAKKRDLITTFTTNGILFNRRRAEEIIEIGIDGISVSIDGPPKINDQIRGQGNFAKAIRAIQILKKIKNQQHRPLPRLKIATVISGFTYPYLSQMVKIADELKIEEITFLHLDYKKQSQFLAHQNCLLTNFQQKVGCLGYIVGKKENSFEKKFTDIDVKILKREIGKISQMKKRVVVSFVPPVAFGKLTNYYQGIYFKNFACTNPWFSATILPNGDLVPCFSLKIGNLMEKDFKYLWNSDFYKKFRRYLKKNRHFPGCFRCCGTTDV